VKEYLRPGPAFPLLWQGNDNNEQTITIQLSEDPSQEIYVKSVVLPEIRNAGLVEIILLDNSERGYSFKSVDEVNFTPILWQPSSKQPI